MWETAGMFSYIYAKKHPSCKKVQSCLNGPSESCGIEVGGQDMAVMV